MRRSLLIASAGFGLLSIALAIGALTSYAERPTTLRVAVAAADAQDSDLMGAAAKLLKRQRRPVRLKVVGTDGAAAAAAALDAGAVDLAVVRTDVGMPEKGETVVLLHKDVALLVVPGGSELDKIADLKGKTIGVVSSGAGDAKLLETALGQYDLAPEAVKTVPLSPDEVGRALKAGTVDAVFAVGLVSAGVVPAVVKAVAAAGEGPPGFLPVAEADAVAQRLPAYESIEVVKGAFGGAPPRPKEEFDTLGVTTRLVANEDLAEGVVASLTRFLLSERGALAEVAPVARRIEAPSTDKGAVLPAHPGTAAYIDDEEETFLDRYSDFIYIGAMVLGVFASGATAIVSRIGAARGLAVEELVERLLAILKAVRVAPSPAALDALDDEVDDILSAALDGGMRSFDARRAAMLTMAVDQVRAAIRDRRNNIRRAGLGHPETIEQAADAPARPALAVVAERLEGGR